MLLRRFCKFELYLFSSGHLTLPAMPSRLDGTVTYKTESLDQDARRPAAPVTASVKLTISSCRLCCGGAGAAAALAGGPPAWLPAGMAACSSAPRHQRLKKLLPLPPPPSKTMLPLLLVSSEVRLQLPLRSPRQGCLQGPGHTSFAAHGAPARPLRASIWCRQEPMAQPASSTAPGGGAASQVPKMVAATRCCCSGADERPPLSFTQYPFQAVAERSQPVLICSKQPGAKGGTHPY